MELQSSNQTSNKPIRRVTGSSNIPLTPEGRAQAKGMQNDLSDTFDHVFTSPEKRSIDTAKHFGRPVILRGLDAWFRGGYEGQPADATKPAMARLIAHPDTVPPGKSPISGKPGETYNQFLTHLMTAVRAVMKHFGGTDKRVLLVTSGGNLQAIDQMIKSGFPDTATPADLKVIAATPYWTQTGVLFLLTDKGLKKVSDNKDSGVYCCEHSSTAFNPASAPKSPK